MAFEKDFPGSDGAALVLGGSGGIGSAICTALADAGTDVTLTYHTNSEAAEKVVANIEAAGRSGAAFPLAMEDRAAVDETLQDVINRFGRIHTVVNASGSHIAMKFLGDITPAVSLAKQGCAFGHSQGRERCDHHRYCAGRGAQRHSRQ